MPETIPQTPAITAPKKQPTKAELVNQPSISTVNPNCRRTKSTVPEMTVSKPKSKPASEATRHTSAKYRGLPFALGVA